MCDQVLFRFNVIAFCWRGFRIFLAAVEMLCGVEP